MSHGIYRITSALDASERRLEQVSHNLANVGTVGYKRRGSAFHSLLTGRPGSQEPVVSHRSTVDQRQGAIIRTGNDLDLALQGHGFFTIDGPGGEVYTRHGSFHVENGALVDNNGQPVAWERLSRPIDPIGEKVVIDRGGAVIQGSVELGRLRIVDFEDAAQLTQDGQGYLHAPRGLREVAHGAEVFQGSLEGSNVNAIAEMVELIEVQRSYERSANTLTMLKQSYERLNRQR